MSAIGSWATALSITIALIVALMGLLVGGTLLILGLVDQALWARRTFLGISLVVLLVVIALLTQAVHKSMGL